MTGTRSSHNHSTVICMLGLALAGVAHTGCDADVPETASGSRSLQAAPNVGEGASVTYTSCRDTWMRRTDAGPVDWGLSRELRTNNVDADEHPEAIFVHFCVDLPTVCPTLTNATLSLQSAQLIGPLAVEAHRITSPWAPGNTGSLPPAPDCQAFSGDSAPFNPPTVVPPVAVTVVDSWCTRFNWNVTPIVQAWCAGAPNLGIRLEGHNGDLEVNFFSMEALIPGRRPMLEINY